MYYVLLVLIGILYTIAVYGMRANTEPLTDDAHFHRVMAINNYNQTMGLTSLVCGTLLLIAFLFKFF